jgi:hypothetical protein
MINGFKIDEAEDIASLEQYLFSYADEFGCSNWIEKDDESDHLFPAVETEDYMNQFIDEYSNLNFWNELIQRLAEKDFFEQNSADTIVEMKTIERIARVDEIAQTYEDEFRKNQLENVIVNMK